VFNDLKKVSTILTLNKMPRVKSKNLFNFQPSGCIDDDIMEMETKMKGEREAGEAQAMIEKMNDLCLKDDEESIKELVTLLRGMSDGMIALMGKDPELVKAGKEVI